MNMNWRNAYNLLKKVVMRSESHIWHAILSKRHLSTFDALLDEAYHELQAMRERLREATAHGDPIMMEGARQRLHDWTKDYEAAVKHERSMAERAFDSLKRLRKDPPNVLEGPYHAASLILSSPGGHWTLAAARPHLRPAPLPANDPHVYRGASIENLAIDHRAGHPLRKLSLLYRGVNSADLPLVPPIFRNFDHPELDVSPDEISHRFDRLDAFRYYLRRHLNTSEHYIGSVDDPDAGLFELAFAQHFKSEARVLTPMLDFTYDPLVALFFASYGGSRPDIGVIYCLSVKSDIQHFSDLGLTGELLTIDLPKVSRLRRQCGVLLYGSKPSFLEQLVPFELKFHQTGEIFEDQELGIDADSLLHIEPDVERVVSTFQSGEGLARTQLVLADEQAVLEGLRLYAAKRHPTDEVDRAIPCLGRLARFHHALHRTAGVPAHLRSIRTLTLAADRCVSNNSGPAFEIILDTYLERLFGDAKVVSDARKHLIGIWRRLDAQDDESPT